MALLAAVVLVVLVPGVSWSAEVCAPALARIVSLQGAVEFRRNESEPWTRAALDDRLCVDYWVRVGPFSRAALALPNDSVLRLDQQTTLRLRAQTEQKRSLLELFLGTLHLFSHRPQALQVDTPFANAATEGTEFLVSVGADQTRIIVFEGRILAQNPDGELLLASGDAAVAMAGEAPRTQIVARPRDAVAWTLYYPPILAALAGREPAARGLPPGLQAAIDQVAANDYAGALRALDAVPEAARDARYYTYRAGVLLNVGRVEDARAAIERALALDPQAGEALAERAVIAIVQNRRTEALDDARRAVELSPDSAAARIALSYAQQANFQLEAARATLREAVEVVPEDALAWASLSEIELSFGELNAALAAANRAVALAPELSRTETVLGFADLARFDVGEAKAAFERAIALDSATPLPRLGLGLAIIRQGDLEQGRNEIEIAVALDPDNSLLRSYLGKAFFEEKRDQLAGEQYAIAKRLDPADPTPWLYDAIRLQTENRPVDALRDLNRSIALNDNRAVFRSSLLLDEDLATRQVSLARIYDDLGFEQVGLLEAARSLHLDPTSAAAHRFLSDVYAGLPRYEIARASQLLQAQLLQPVNINPVQPSLPITDLNIVAGAGPASVTSNELTPMFQRNGLQLSTTGIAGNNTTFGDEVVASALWNRLSFSVGQLYTTTDGFRQNNDVKNKLYDVYTQIAVTPQINLQAEYRYRDTDQGDLELNFDPDQFSPIRLDLNQSTGRVGARLSPSPNSDILLSFIYTDAIEKQDFLKSRAQDNGWQGEAQYILDAPYLNIIAGASSYDIDAELKLRAIDLERHFSRRQETGYLYTDFDIFDSVTLTLGGAFDHYKQAEREFNLLSPKVGLEWDVTKDIRFRMAAFQLVKPPLVVQQTVQPTEVAGFNQFFDDINGTKVQSYGIGIDSHLFKDVYGGAEVYRRNLSVPRFQFLDEDTEIEKQKQDVARAYLYWTPMPEWSISVEYQYDEIKRKDTQFDPDPPKKLETMTVPLTARYFSRLGWFAQFGVTYLRQKVSRAAGSSFQDGTESVALVDVEAGYRLPKRFGIVSVEVSNLLDQSFNYQDTNFFTDKTRTSRFIPERTILARATLNF